MARCDMLGRRTPQRSLFEADVCPHRVAPDSLYGRMAVVRDVLFNDDDLAEMYCPDNGRPSLPPSLLCGVVLLQFHDGVGDEEAVERLCYDLRWKAALGFAVPEKRRGPRCADRRCPGRGSLEHPPAGGAVGCVG